MTLTPAVAIVWFVLVTAGCTLAWMPAGRRRLSHVRHPLLLAAALAVLARAVPAALQPPPDALVQFDIESYRLVGEAVLARRDVYALPHPFQPPRYPYLPLQLYLFAAAVKGVALTGVPFVALVKLPAIAADAALAVLVGQLARSLGRADAPALATVFALNPISVLVTGYFGQFDALPTALVLAAWLVLRQHERRWPLSAVLLGLAVADKTWPALLTPAFLLRVGAGRARRGLTVAAGYVALSAVPVLLCLAFYQAQIAGGAHRALVTVREYQGVGVWGYAALATRLADPAKHADALRLADDLTPWVLLTVLACAYTAALWLRGDAERLALIVVALYAGTPSWGWNWLTWLVPFALLCARWWSPAYIAVGGAFVALVYLGFGGVVWGFVAYTGTFGPIDRFRDAELVLWGTFALAVALACARSVPRGLRQLVHR